MDGRLPSVQRGAYQIKQAARQCAVGIRSETYSIRTRGEKPMPVRVEPMMVTTATELPGNRIVRNIGIVRGIIVRSRSILGSLGAGLERIIGGNITRYTQLCEKTRAKMRTN